MDFPVKIKLEVGTCEYAYLPRPAHVGWNKKLIYPNLTHICHAKMAILLSHNIFLRFDRLYGPLMLKYLFCISVTQMLISRTWQCLLKTNDSLFASISIWWCHKKSLTLSSFPVCKKCHLSGWNIVKILNIFIMLSCTHLYHSSFRYLSITCNTFIACYIRH